MTLLPPVQTPWGPSTTLPDRRLKPGPGTPPADVKRNQVERFMAALVAAVDAHGYSASRVADLVAISGVSRSAFYQHFSSLEECYLRTLDQCLLYAGEQLDRDDGNTLDAGLRRFYGLTIDQPAATRLVLRESHAVGPKAVEIVNQAIDRAALRVQFEVPPELTPAIAGGIIRVADRGLDRWGDWTSDIRKWVASYPPPRRPLERPTAAPTPAEIAKLTTARDRLIAATGRVAIDVGYRHMTIAAIADLARCSLSTFYGHFDNGEAAFRAAVEHHLQLTRAAVSVGFSKGFTYEGAVVAAIDALLDYIASRPGVAYLLFGEAPALPASDVAEVVAHDIYAPRPALSEVVVEAIAGGIHHLIAREVRAGRAANLRGLAPTITYLVLAPITAESALAEAVDHAAVVAA